MLVTLLRMAVNPEKQAFRLARLVDAVTRYGDEDALGVKLGYKNGAFVRQMLREIRPISEKTVARIEELPGMAGWFQALDAGPIVLTEEERAMVLAFRERLNKPFAYAKQNKTSAAGARHFKKKAS